MTLFGVKVPHRKNTKDKKPLRMSAPSLMYYPASQHIGAPGKPVVKVGDTVNVGSLLFESGGFVGSPIYSSVSGKVKKIEDMLQSNGSYVPCVVVENDGENVIDPSVKAPNVNDYDSFINAVKASGVVGLGGAGFPTAVKLGVGDVSRIEIVVINGAECEPYITSDTRTMLDRSEDISEGIHLLRKYLGVEKVVIGIEKNKPECIEEMKRIAGQHEGVVEVKPLPSIYPQGGEKVLVYNATGRVIGEGKLPIDAGVIVINCTTLACIASYIRDGMPLVEKCVTVDGSAVKEPQNVIVPIGTPASAVFDFCGGFKEEPGKVLYGGPMMGVSVSDLNAPVIKQTNALIAFNEKDAMPKKTTPCIRCGRCTNTCPFGLAPVSFAKAYEQNDMEMLEKLRANLCMECGCCAYACPAGIPLVQKNKLAKAALAAYLKKKKEENK
ncbi:MAG: electron transport complex subunit RsxC [Clostridia bacterium]|nr:electron transport complex subunit RsxC [Clostridia bacterium]